MLEFFWQVVVFGIVAGTLFAISTKVVEKMYGVLFDTVKQTTKSGEFREEEDKDVVVSMERSRVFSVSDKDELERIMEGEKPNFGGDRTESKEADGTEADPQPRPMSSSMFG